MADKYLKLDTSNGLATEVEATVSSAGAGNAGDVVALDGTGKLDESVLPVGIGAETQSIEATENLSAGDLVNVYASTGAKVRKADANTSGKPAHGFVLSAVTSGDDATVYFAGLNTQVTGLTPGDTYFLDDTAGGTVDAPPTGSGKVSQRVGVASAAGVLVFAPGDVYVQA